VSAFRAIVASISIVIQQIPQQQGAAIHSDQNAPQADFMEN
jgi:hypothetical protein